MNARFEQGVLIDQR